MKRFLTSNLVAFACTACAIFCMVSSAAAGELTYKPTNPAFGGNPFNGPYLLSNATAQRQHEAPETKRDSAIEEFGENVQRSLLSRLSRDIADQIIGEDAKDSGSFKVGDTHLDFHREGQNVVINIADPQTGEATTIELPVPEY